MFLNPTLTNNYCLLHNNWQLSCGTQKSYNSLWSSARYLFFASAYLAALGSSFDLLPFPGFPFRGSLSVRHPTVKELTGYPKFSDGSLHTYRALYSDRRSGNPSLRDETSPFYFPVSFC